MTDREFRIKNLTKKLDNVVNILRKKPASNSELLKNLVRFEKLEREIQIQQAFAEHESL